jgi:4'-phosphopantetheinyl transferase
VGDHIQAIGLTRYGRTGSTRQHREAACVVVRWLAVGPAVETAALERLLDASERTRADRFRFAVDRDAYIAAHALKRVMLSNEAPIAPGEWRFRAASGGKPDIDPSLGCAELRFSLSHARGMVACAVGRGDEVGVDVERLDPSLHPLETARQVLAPSEVALIGALPPARRLAAFSRIWTLKEAYLKATGEGLAGLHKGFAFSLDPVSVAFDSVAHGQPQSWQFAEFAPGPGYCLSLALRRPETDRARLDPQAATQDQAGCLATGRPARKQDGSGLCFR